jgi:hypothetical protein
MKHLTFEKWKKLNMISPQMGIDPLKEAFHANDEYIKYLEDMIDNIKLSIKTNNLKEL